MSELEIKAGKFIAWLKSRGDDRGMMADLRRGFSAVGAYRSWPWLASWCDLSRSRERTIVQTIAAAFATHPQVSEKGNLGTVCRQIAGRKGEGLKSFEALFRRFLACQTSGQVCRLIPGLIRAAKAKSIPANYHSLYTDLSYYSGRGVEVVRSRWAAEFWGGSGDEEEGGPLG